MLLQMVAVHITGACEHCSALSTHSAMAAPAYAAVCTEALTARLGLEVCRDLPVEHIGSIAFHLRRMGTLPEGPLRRLTADLLIVATRCLHADDVDAGGFVFGERFRDRTWLTAKLASGIEWLNALHRVPEDPAPIDPARVCVGDAVRACYDGVWWEAVVRLGGSGGAIPPWEVAPPAVCTRM